MSAPPAPTTSGGPTQAPASSSQAQLDAKSAAVAALNDRKRMHQSEAVDIVRVLESAGVEEYDPSVINMLMEFSFRYVYDVIRDASMFSKHAKRDTLEQSDVKLAVQCKVDTQFTKPLPRDAYASIARMKNKTRIPAIPMLSEQRLPSKDNDPRIPVDQNFLAVIADQAIAKAEKSGNVPRHSGGGPVLSSANISGAKKPRSTAANSATINSPKNVTTARSSTIQSPRSRPSAGAVASGTAAAPRNPSANLARAAPTQAPYAAPAPATGGIPAQPNLPRPGAGLPAAPAGSPVYASGAPQGNFSGVSGTFSGATQPQPGLPVTAAGGISSPKAAGTLSSQQPLPASGGLPPVGSGLSSFPQHANPPAMQQHGLSGTEGLGPAPTGGLSSLPAAGLGSAPSSMAPSTGLPAPAPGLGFSKPAPGNAPGSAPGSNSMQQ